MELGPVDRTEQEVPTGDDFGDVVDRHQLPLDSADLGTGIVAAEPVQRYFDLPFPDSLLGVENLTVEVRQFHLVKVDHAQIAHTRPKQSQRNVRTDAPEAEQGDLAVSDALLHGVLVVGEAGINVEKADVTLPSLLLVGVERSDRTG